MNKPKRQRGDRNILSATIDSLECRAYLTASFSGPTNVSGVSSATAIAVATFTSASTPDVVVSGQRPSSPGSPVLGVYLQNSGTFGTPTIMPFTGTTAGAAAGDFLGNGKQDIAAIDSSTNTLDVFLNDGAGDFSPGAGASLGGTPGDTVLAAADFNADGKTDIAAVDPADNEVVTFLSNGNVFGSFSAGATISVPSPIDVVAADFNGDLQQDLAILSSNGDVYIATNLGNGSFSTPIPYSLGIAGADPTSMVVANFNADNKPDIAVVGSAIAGGAASVFVLLNNGDGTFGSANSVGVVPTNPRSILSGNFIGSGQTDLAVLDGDGGLTVIPSNGDGTFGSPQSIVTNQLSVGSDAVAADFNGDGVTDIAYLDSAGGGFSELVNTSAGSVTTKSPLVPSLLSPVPTATLVAGQKVKPIHEMVKLTNSGTSTLGGATTVDLTLSSTTDGVSTDPIVASFSKNVVLKAGKSKMIPLTIKSIPSGLDGSYFIRATVLDSLSESNAVASAGKVNIIPPTIDLTGTVLSTPASAKIGKAAAVSFTVTNLGSIAVAGPLTIDVSASDIQGVDSTTVTFDDLTKTHVNIKPGGVLKIRVRNTIQANVPNPFYIVVQVDPNDAYNESETANNEFFSATPISVS